MSAFQVKHFSDSKSGSKSKSELQYSEIIFHSESVRNAFGLADSVELLKISKSMIKRGSGSLVFRNAGSYFCAGGDLQSILKLKTKKQGVDLNSKIEKNLSEFARLPLYKIALVSGDCFGGGMELLSCFDLRLSVSAACFGFFQKRFELTTGWGGFARWKNLGVAGSAVGALLASGRVFSAYEACRSGFIHEILVGEDIDLSLQRILLKLSLDSNAGRLQKLSSMNSSSEKKVFNELWWSKGHLSALEKFKK